MVIRPIFIEDSIYLCVDNALWVDEADDPATGDPAMDEMYRPRSLSGIAGSGGRTGTNFSKALALERKAQRVTL